MISPHSHQHGRRFLHTTMTATPMQSRLRDKDDEGDALVRLNRTFELNGLLVFFGRETLFGVTADSLEDESEASQNKL